MNDVEDYSGSSDAEEDLSIRMVEVTKSPLKSDLLPLLDCPVCYDLALPPIFTCCLGHIICGSCIPLLRTCPLCLQHIGTGRNFFAEDFLNKCTIRCKYQEDGCLVELPGTKIKKHVEDCSYRPLKCRLCKVKVGYADIDEHLFRKHGISRWDLNDEGFRILMCHKHRARNPYSRRRGIINDGQDDDCQARHGIWMSRCAKILMPIVAISVSIIMDHCFFDGSDLGLVLQSSVISKILDSLDIESYLPLSHCQLFFAS